MPKRRQERLPVLPIREPMGKGMAAATVLRYGEGSEIEDSKVGIHD
jgi:hypothetical protein